MAEMQDGFSTTISYAEDSSVVMSEISVTPPGVSGGGAIDQTTMGNTTYRTQAPKSLKSLSDAGATVSYDPAVLTEILAMVNVNQLITITFPDSQTWAFYGWIDEFTPGELVEGQRPTATLKIIPSQLNGSDVETAPLLG